MLTTLLLIENNNVKEDCMHNTARGEPNRNVYT